MPSNVFARISFPFFAAALLSAPAVASQDAPFERTEDREPCADYESTRRPFYGDLHVHSSYSFDSYTSGQRNDPWGAHRYAMGEPITLPGPHTGEKIQAQLRRPLDFVSVTDHAEYLGEINLCTGAEWSLAYFTPLCMMTRADNFYIALMAAGSWSEVVGQQAGSEKKRIWQCAMPGSDCPGRQVEFWEQMQQAADDFYDRSSECKFTTFIGYEYTDTPNQFNMHRNVIFRNDRVTKAPISSYDTGAENFPELWRRLRSECIEAGNGCDVIAIPHNSNLAGGKMFRDPVNELEVRERLFFEPIVELLQHKAASECRFDRQLGRGVGTADELCTFEQNKTDSLASLAVLFGEVMMEKGEPRPLDDFARRNLVRNVLKDGLALEQKNGANPFKMGFIGSTDTHSAAPGGAEEDNFVGHLGRRDAGFRNVQDHIQDGPGGLAVVWAEENSRDSIFAGMRRKETYATSGTRPTVRTFGGWTGDFAASVCEAEDMVDQGYAAGVPMGGDLAARPSDTARPNFLVSALKDAGSEGYPGADLQRIQIVKGWVDANGATHEEIFDVAGDAHNGASVDPDTCAPTGSGAAELCTVWEDPEFDAGQGAFYYTRVLENPTCRWSTHQCIAAGVNPFAENCTEQAAARNAEYNEAGDQGDVFGNCCWTEANQPFHERTIQERAWTSPIWYQPN